MAIHKGGFVGSHVHVKSSNKGRGSVKQARIRRQVCGKPCGGKPENRIIKTPHLIGIDHTI